MKQDCLWKLHAPLESKHNPLKAWSWCSPSRKNESCSPTSLRNENRIFGAQHVKVLKSLIFSAVTPLKRFFILCLFFWLYEKLIWFGFWWWRWVRIICDCSRSLSFYILDSIAISRYPSLTEDADCSFFLLPKHSCLRCSSLKCHSLPDLQWGRISVSGARSTTWPLLSASFPVFRQSIDSLSTFPFFMLNDAPALLFTPLSFSTKVENNIAN